MKRHPTLQPLSRQHHLGLVIANKAKSVTDDDKLTHHQALVEYLTTTIPTHFEIERTRLADVILTKLSDDKAVKLAKQMLDEHEYIESLLATTPTQAWTMSRSLQMLCMTISALKSESFFPLLRRC